jgi:hypothetical protein
MISNNTTGAAMTDLTDYIESVHKEIDRNGGDISTAIGIVIGAASACWSNLEGAGVFESERASALVDVLLERVGTDATRKP